MLGSQKFAHFVQKGWAWSAPQCPPVRSGPRGGSLMVVSNHRTAFCSGLTGGMQCVTVAPASMPR